MRSPSRLTAAGAALAAAAALSLGAAPAGATPPPPAQADSCLWGPALNINTINQAFPNGTITTYWYSSFKLPPGASVVLRGSYPRARYQSLTSYFTVEGDPQRRGVPSDSLYDAQIAPDPGSANPFLPGARRVPSRFGRNWTATVSGQTPPANAADRAPNTLYAGTLPADQDQPVELMVRVYAPDKGFDVSGGSGLPAATLVLADGTQLSGQAACDALTPTTQFPAVNGFTLNQYLALTNLPPNPAAGFPGSRPEAPATDPPRWYRPVNACHFQDPFFQAAGYPAPTCPSTTAVNQWAAKDNAYIAAYVDRRFGPAPGGRNVVVIRGKMPSTPSTYQGDTVFRGGKQVRYWGICMNESFYTTRTTVEDGCAYDERIPTDAQGRYTIVVSAPEDRPPNATERCGVTWLNWGDGDGAPAPYAKPTSGLLIVRELLADPAYAQGADKIPAPGLPEQVAATMGEYVPKLDYQSPAQFQDSGCKPKQPAWLIKWRSWLRTLR